jgi:hypothetical protein
MTEDVDASTALGRNARALRGSASLDDVARAARRYGLTWNVGRVSDLEYGRVSPRIDALIPLALALAEVSGQEITLGDLLRSDENITLTKNLTVTNDELQGFLRGATVSVDERYMAEAIQAARAALKARDDWPPRLKRVKHGVFVDVWQDYGAAEQLLARDLGIDRDQLTAEMAALWGRAFHVERDAIAGEGASAQKRGNVARTLKAQLKARIDGDHQ